MHACIDIAHMLDSSSLRCQNCPTPELSGMLRSGRTKSTAAKWQPGIDPKSAGRNPPHSERNRSRARKRETFCRQ